MGCSQKSYIFSWLSYFILNGMLVSTVMLLITKIFIVSDKTAYKEGYGFIHIAALFFLFTISNIGFVLILCPFFSKVKTGIQVIFIIFRA
jgi:hypothetical protein